MLTSANNRNSGMISHQMWNWFDKLKISGNPFTIDELVDKLKGGEVKPTLFIDFL